MSVIVQVVDLSKVTSDTFCGAVRADGGDVRMTNSANAQIPLHLVEFDKTNRKGIAFAQSNAVPVRVWSKTSQAAQPAVGSANGQHSVYDATHIAVWPTGTGTDATSNGLVLTDTTDAIETTVPSGYFTNLPASVRTGFTPSDSYSHRSSNIASSSEYTFEFWFKATSLSPDSSATLFILGRIPDNSEADPPIDNHIYSGLALALAPGSASHFVLSGVYERVSYDNSFDPIAFPDQVYYKQTLSLISSGDLAFGVFHHAAFTWKSDGTIAIKVDGVDSGACAQSQSASSVNGDVPASYLSFATLDQHAPLQIGGFDQVSAASTADFLGQIGLVAIYNVAQTTGWAHSRYVMLAGQTESAFTNALWPN